MTPHHVTLLRNWRVTLSFSLVIMTVRFHRESPVLHQPSDITVIQPQPDYLCVCVCVEKEMGWGVQGAAQTGFAQQIACQCPIWKNFHLTRGHVISSKPRHVSSCLSSAASPTSCRVQIIKKKSVSTAVTVPPVLKRPT